MDLDSTQNDQSGHFELLEELGWGIEVGMWTHNHTFSTATLFYSFWMRVSHGFSLFSSGKLQSQLRKEQISCMESSEAWHAAKHKTALIHLHRHTGERCGYYKKSDYRGTDVSDWSEVYLGYCRGCQWRNLHSTQLRGPPAGRWCHFLHSHTGERENKHRYDSMLFITLGNWSFLPLVCTIPASIN